MHEASTVLSARQEARWIKPTKLSLRTYALAAVAATAYGRGSETDSSIEMRLLGEKLGAVASNGKDWAESFPVYLRDPVPSDRPLVDLAGEMNLSMVETLAVALAIAVDDDMVVGRCLAHLQKPIGGSRPTVGLVATSLSALEPASEPIKMLTNGVALKCGLLRFIGPGAPLPEQSISVPLHLIFALSGMDGELPGTSIGLGSYSEVPLPSSIRDEAARQALALDTSSQRALVIRTGSVAEGRSAAAAIARELDRRPLFIETDVTEALSPWLVSRGLLPVFQLELGPGERKVLPSIPFYNGPVLAICGPDGFVEMTGGSTWSWSLPVPSVEDRESLWRRAIGCDELSAELARDHRHSSGRIAHLGRLARHRSNLAGREQPRREDVVAAAWVSEGAGLDALAHPIRDPISEEAIVMPDGLRRELELLHLRCSARGLLVNDLGASAVARYQPGVRALFVGPSGTGKTLAAGWLATRLGIPLYRVDLAAVTSKYIGETEKNLAQLLARAEQAEVVLLFDEADSMFGKRTDIRESNDRFANAQTNYLLQRIESFDGIVVMTSNSRSRFDAAFTRRIDMVLDFPMPGPEERRALWNSHLGERHDVEPQEINKLAATADLCGGHIRNVVLAAAVLARSEERRIGYDDVRQGLEAEYRKLGKQVPVELKSR